MNMDTSMELNTNIIGVYTSPPRKITETRLSYKISLYNNQKSLNNNNDNDNDNTNNYKGIMQKRMHILLCYKNQSNEDSGWHVGGWIKASLGNALSEYPILAGRIRRSEKDDELLEIVSNDGGVRCVEAEVDMSLVDFIESKEKNEIEEGNLVYWEDIDEPNLQFSPLLCIQVTNFKCGGYSIGISCHILLADTSFIAKFLQRWTEFHRSLAYEGEMSKISLFNTQNMKKPIGYSLPTRPISNISAKKSKTMLFEIFTYEIFKSMDEMCNFFVLLCLEEAESKIDNKISSNFTLVTRESNGNVTVVTSSKEALSKSPKTIKYEFKTLNLDDLGVNEIAFLKEKGPIDASYWMSCDSLEAMVIVVMSPPSENQFGMKVYITLPWV